MIHADSRWTESPTGNRPTPQFVSCQQLGHTIVVLGEVSVATVKGYEAILLTLDLLALQLAYFCWPAQDTANLTKLIHENRPGFLWRFCFQEVQNYGTLARAEAPQYKMYWYGGAIGHEQLNG